MESPHDLRKIWDCILTIKDDDTCHSEACANLVVMKFYGERLQMVLKYLRDRFFSCAWSTLDSFNQDESGHTRITVLKSIIRYSRTICSSRSFIYSHYCKELLIDLLSFEAKDTLFHYNDGDLLTPIYNQICIFRKLHCPSTLRGTNLQQPNLYFEGIHIPAIPIKEISLLYSELSPNHKTEVQGMVEGVLLFDTERYLSDFTQFISIQLKTSLPCHIAEFLHRLSTFEEGILSVLHQILPLESKFNPAQTLARVCNATICLSIKINPKRHWEDMNIIIGKLLKEELSVCSTIVSFMDHTILALMINKQLEEFVDIMSSIVCKEITVANDIQTLFRSLFVVDILTSHTGVYYTKLLNIIHTKLNNVTSSENCSIKEQIGLYAATFINFYHITRETEVLMKIMPHKSLFLCKLFEEQILLDLFSRMTALRMELTFVSQNLNKASYIMAELELFVVLASISTTCFIQLYAYVLTISTGCREAHQLETKSKILYNLIITSGWKSSILKIAEMIATLVQPITSSNIEIGFSCTHLPETIKTAICGARFVTINIRTDGRLRMVREDCLHKLLKRNCVTDYLDQLISENYFYIPISPEDMKLPLKLTDSLDDKVISDNNNDSSKPIMKTCHKETKKLEIMAHISRTVKTSERISIEDLINIYHERYKAIDAITQDEILDAVQHLIESDILEWTGEKMLQWYT